MTEKIYHIYAKDQCIYHSLPEEDFIKTWDALNKFISVFGNLSKDDISYEELNISKEVISNSSY